MFRSIPIGVIYNEHSHSYRQLFRAVPVPGSPSSRSPHKDVQLARLNSNLQRPSIGDTKHKSQADIYSNSRNNIMSRQGPVNNSVKAQSNSRVMSPVSAILSRAPDALNDHVSNYRRRQFGSFSIGENKSYQEVDTAADRSRLYPQRINKEGEKTSGRQAASNHPEDMARLNDALRSLSQLLQGKTREVNKLTEELQHKQHSLLEANQNVQFCLSKLTEDGNYGVESRKKLRAEIDYLKECYGQLLRRVDAETFQEVAQGNTKKQTMRESLGQFNQSVNKMSVNTASLN